MSHCCDCQVKIDKRAKRCPSCAARFRETKGASLEERFWSKIDKNGPIMPGMTTPCWIWTGFKIKNSGYGQFRTEIKTIYTHRYSYELHYGPFPKELDICHHCDNPACARPDHLFAGTSQDNMDDMKKKGRSCKGEKTPKAKLTDRDVAEIRELYSRGGISQRQLAHRYRISSKVIWTILKAKAWKHI